MKILIYSFLFLIFSTSLSFTQTLNSFSSNGHKSALSNTETMYQDISLGFGYYSGGSDKDKNGAGLNLGFRHQFTETFYLECKFDYVASKDGMYLLAAIPQWSLAKSSKVNFLLGVGLVFIAIPKEIILPLPIASTKLEYRISERINIYPELKFPPFIASINLAYRLPLTNK